MQEQSSAQQLPLVGMQQGQFMTIIVTDATQAVTLQFQHQDNTTWYDHPDATAVAVASGLILIKDIQCLGSKMRLNFAAAPGGTYQVSVLWRTVPTF